MLEEGQEESDAGDPGGIWGSSRAAVRHGGAGCAFVDVAEAQRGALGGWMASSVQPAELDQDVLAERGYDGEPVAAGVPVPSLSSAHVPAISGAAVASPWFPGGEEEPGESFIERAKGAGIQDPTELGCEVHRVVAREGKRFTF